ARSRGSAPPAAAPGPRSRGCCASGRAGTAPPAPWPQGPDTPGCAAAGHRGCRTNTALSPCSEFQHLAGAVKPPATLPCAPNHWTLSPPMKYRHAYHAGNFADVHKHVTLLALLAALQRKDKGFFYLDTHAGRGVYDLSTPAAESAAGVGRFQQGVHSAPELRAYAQALSAFHDVPGNAH